MQRFFDRPDTHWRSLRDCLHIYAVPSLDSDVRAAFASMVGPLSSITGLGQQPVEHVHMTVQRLDAFGFELSDRALNALVERLDEAVRPFAPFALEFNKPLVTSDAIQAIAPPPAEWERLSVAVRSAIAQAGLGGALTQPPPAPHYTLAYGTAEGPDIGMTRVIGLHGQPSRAVVDSISLVSVDQDPVGGSFRFTALREFPFDR